jgi:hypothetical protein
MIWDEGKEIHKKWQNRFWDLGRLQGMFYCFKCQYAWWGQSPEHCVRCDAERVFLTFHEVPLYNADLRLAGHADGQDGDDAVIEIKSIGVNTLLFEAPDLLRAHTYHLNINGKKREFIDHDALWDSIRVPFPSHIRQGHLYSFLGAPHDEIFIYECKWNQRTKEIVVKYREDRIADRLDSCREICQALAGGTPPKCPREGCPDCRRYEESTDDAPAKPRRIITRPTSSTPPTTPDRRGLQNGVRSDGGARPEKRLLRDRSRGA